MKTNKEQVLARYAELVEARKPGKGRAARQLIETNWTPKMDSWLADRMGWDQMGDNLVVVACKEVVLANPALNDQLRAL